MKIRSFSNSKKATEYLEKGKSYCFYLDHHGIGDLIMFMPLYRRVKELYPDIEINFRARDFQSYFNDITRNDYDFEFFFDFYEPNNPCVKDRTWLMSKPETCAKLELGIPFDKSLEFTWKPSFRKNSNQEKQIGIAFNVQSNQSRCMNYESARQLWATVSMFAKPIEVQFQVSGYSRQTPQFDFVEKSCRSVEATPENMFDVIGNLDGFIGVNTGTTCAAITMGKPVLHMYKDERFYPHYMRTRRIDESMYWDKGIIAEDVENFLFKIFHKDLKYE